MKTLIYHHLGLGDHIICNAIVRYFYEKYGMLSLFVKKHNYPSVQALYRDIKINLIKVNNDLECYDFFKDYNVIKVGFEKTTFPNWEESFYHQLNMDYSLRFSKFYIERDYQRERSLEKKLNLPKEFALCNNSYSGGKIDINFKTNIHKIFLSPITDSLFDWIGVIEKAKEIHTMDSSIFQLIKQLDIKVDKYFYDTRKISQSRTSPPTKNWIVVSV